MGFGSCNASVNLNYNFEENCKEEKFKIKQILTEMQKSDG